MRIAVVNSDFEGTGYGERTEVLIEAKDNCPAMKCQMKLPPM